jgi:uncharacterized protein (TIGR00297 family)
MPHFSQPLFGLLLAAAVAALAYRAGALTRSGALAAWGVGAMVFGVGGWLWAAALLTFFGTSTALSRWRRRAKETLGYEKGGRRDAGQVLANGGVAALCALLPLAFPALGMAHAHLLFLAALAAANADTWATELGSALGGHPYDLRTGKPAPPGTSGAVSLLGTLAALAGAGLIGLYAGGGVGWGTVTAAGLGGAFLDSLLGATVQARWRDPLRPWLLTEHPQAGPPDWGRRGINNDLVNALCTLGAVTLALCLIK